MHSRSRKYSSGGGIWGRGCWGAPSPVVFLAFSTQERLESTFKGLGMRRLRVGLQCGPATPLFLRPRTQTLWRLLKGVTSLPAVVLGSRQS